MADAKPSRQRPGQACLSCRAKKLKCDGEQPLCSNCAISNVACVIPLTSAKRGPPKGHMKAMQTRLANLEQRLHLLDPTGNAFLQTVNPGNVANISAAPAAASQPSTAASPPPIPTATTSTAAPQVPAMFTPSATSMSPLPDNHTNLSPAFLNAVLDQYPFPDKTTVDMDITQHTSDQSFQLSSPGSGQPMLATIGDMFNFSTGGNFDAGSDAILGDDLLRTDL